MKDDKGIVVHWACETVSPGLLVRAGWSKNEWKPRYEIITTLNLAKSGAPVGYTVKQVLADGRDFILDRAATALIRPTQGPADGGLGFW